MSYKIQTNKTRAFLIQDLLPLILVLLGAFATATMAYVNIAHRGESCGIGPLDSCSAFEGYLVMIPFTVLLVGTFLKMVYNLFKIGTVTKINLEYRNFTGSTSAENRTNDINTARQPAQQNFETIDSVATPPRNVTELTKPVTDFPYMVFFKRVILFMIITATLLAFTPVPSVVHVLVIYVIPLFAILLSIEFLVITEKILTVKFYAKNGYIFKRMYKTKDMSQTKYETEQVLDYYKNLGKIAKNILKMIAIGLIFLIIGAFVAGISAGISESIYN